MAVTWCSSLSVDEPLFCDFGDVEIGELEHLVRELEDIGAFDVAVDDVKLVELGESDGAKLFGRENTQ